MHPMFLYVRSWRRHWAVMLLIWLTVGGTITGWALLTPDVFRSAGTLYVRLGRENVSVDPTANFGQGQISAVPLSRDNEINTVVETLRSRALLEQVVDEVSTEAILKDQKRLIDYLRTPRMPPREYAILRLEKMVKVAARRKSNLVGVTVDARNAELARQAATSLVNHFVQFHRDLNSNPKAHQFFVQQTELLRDELLKTEDELTHLRNNGGISSAPEQRRLLLSRLSELEGQIRETDAEIEQAKSAIEIFGGQTKRLPERRLLETAVVANQAKDGMRERLYELQLREKLLAARFKDDHPELVLVREQHQQALETYEAEKAERTNVTEGRSRAFEQAELALLERQAELSVLETRRNSLAPQLVALQSRLRDLNEADMKLARLERQREIQAENFTKYSHSLEQTRIDESLRADHISNISIVEEPAVSYRPVQPDRPLLIGLAVAAATILAAAYGVAMEQFYMTPRRRNGLSVGGMDGRFRQVYQQAQPEHA